MSGQGDGDDVIVTLMALVMAMVLVIVRLVLHFVVMLVAADEVGAARGLEALKVSAWRHAWAGSVSVRVRTHARASR